MVFLVGTGGVGIRQLEVKWEDKYLYRFLYAFVYRLYDPSFPLCGSIVHEDRVR
jgi:hypothetical protein